MRHLFFGGLATLFAIAAVAADAPIPQDAARLVQQRRERLEWNRSTLGGAYAKDGKHAPRWDKAAREALDLAARMYSEEIDPEVTDADVYKAAKAAVDAGCDDPLVRYLYHRTQTGPNYPGHEQAIQQMKQSATGLTASRYPAIRRAIALLRAGIYEAWADDPDEATRTEAEHDLDAALALLAESFARDDHSRFWRDQWFNLATEAIAGYRRLGTEPTAACQRIENALAKVPELKALKLKVRGIFSIQYGWEARGTSIGALVGQDAYEKFGERLNNAREALEESWRLSPDDAAVAANLLEIDKSIGGDRATMERWFDRAMKADGDSYMACAAKLDWLDPKWHGTAEQMLAFGKVCRATNNSRVGITLLGAEAHVRYAGMHSLDERTRYLGSPAVWSEIQAVFDEYLKHHPSHANQRTRYAMIAVMANKPREAHTQFQRLGDRLMGWNGAPYLPSLEQVKRARDEIARAIALEASGGNKLGWLQFGGRNADGRWSVRVPGKPERRQAAGILGARARNVFASTAAGVTYSVRVQPVPPAVLKRGVQAVLDAARDAVAGEYHGKARDEKPATLAEQPGLDYVIDAPGRQPAAVRVRVGLIGNRLYELSVAGTPADVASPAAETFLVSFQFQ